MEAHVGQVPRGDCQDLSKCLIVNRWSLFAYKRSIMKLNEDDLFGLLGCSGSRNKPVSKELFS